MIPRVAVPISNIELFSSLIAVAQAGNDEVTKFEKSLANYLGVKKVYAVNSGRTALYLALKSLNLKRGQGVIVPAFTCAIVFEVILRLGLKPILIDVNPKTYNIDPELIPNSITSEAKVMIPVHLFGRPCEMSQIMEIANKFDLLVIEDVAQALGARYNGKKVGTFGDLAIFSFGPGKSITSGEGGALAVNNDELVNKIESIWDHLPEPSISWQLRVTRNILAMKFFSSSTYYKIIKKIVEDELNKSDSEIVKNCITLMTKQSNDVASKTIKLMKMPSSSARMARMQLRKIDDLNGIRITNARFLLTALSSVTNFVQLPEASNDNILNTFTRFPIKLRKNLIKRVEEDLRNRGIDVERPYYYLPCILRIYQNNRYIHTEELSRSLITVPNHPCLNQHDIVKISHSLIQSILSAYSVIDANYSDTL
jgi:dTDP-4-amino-4,6-dideoxygalactose transaminase